MRRNDCCIHFCIGCVAFLQITTSVARTIDRIALIKQLDLTTMIVESLVDFTFLVSGSLLTFGAIKRKAKLVYVHLVITVISLALCPIGLVSQLMDADLPADDGHAILTWSSVASFLILTGLECVVFKFYKNLKNEQKEVDNIEATYKI